MNNVSANCHRKQLTEAWLYVLFVVRNALWCYESKKNIPQCHVVRIMAMCMETDLLMNLFWVSIETFQPLWLSKNLKTRNFVVEEKQYSIRNRTRQCKIWDFFCRRRRRRRLRSKNAQNHTDWAVVKNRGDKKAKISIASHRRAVDLFYASSREKRLYFETSLIVCVIHIYVYVSV